MVMSPVGARCPSCAQVKRFVIMLKPAEVARALAHGIGAATGGTILYFFVPFLGPLISFALIGFGVGEATSIGANKKRVRELSVLAVVNLVIGFVLGFGLFGVLQGGPFRLELFLAPILVLRQPVFLVGLLVGALLAWMRAR